MELELSLKLFKTLQLASASIPVRSQLYQLQPIAICTSSTESLTSFINRLAEAHGVSTGALISQVIAVSIKKKYILNGQSKGLHKLYARTSLINGSGLMALDWASAIQSLTLVNQIRQLTLLNWGNVLPARNLLRQSRAWCPHCYQEWFSKQQVIYEPLVWILDIVKICQKHYSSLVTNCPYCKRQIPWLDWQTRPGYCSKCNQWLGDYSKDKLGHALKQDELKWEIWVANNVGALVSTSSICPDKEMVAQSLASCIKIVTGGNVAEFARMLHLPKNTVWLWQAGKNLPTLDKLLRICYLVQVPLLGFLTGQTFSEKSLEILVLPCSSTSNTLRLPSRHFDSIEIGNALKRELLSHAYPPLGVKEIATRLGYDIRLLRKHHPELCHSLSRKYACYRRACRLRRLESLSKEVQTIAFKLYDEGIYPTRAKVATRLTKPGCFRELAAREALHEALRILGLR